MPVQLDRRDEAEPREWMRGLPERAMAIAQEPVDAAAAQDVVAVAAAEHPEVRLEVEPAGLGRREDQGDPQALGERQEARVVVDVAQVVQGDVDAPVAGSRRADAAPIKSERHYL